MLASAPLLGASEGLHKTTRTCLLSTARSQRQRTQPTLFGRGLELQEACCYRLDLAIARRMGGGLRRSSSNLTSQCGRMFLDSDLYQETTRLVRTPRRPAPNHPPNVISRSSRCASPVRPTAVSTRQSLERSNLREVAEPSSRPYTASVRALPKSAL